MTKKERIEALNNYIDSQLWSMEHARKYADGQKDLNLKQKIVRVHEMTSYYQGRAIGVIQFATMYEGLNLTEQETDDMYRIIANVFENCNDWTKEFEPYNE